MTATFFQLLLAKPARMSIIVYRENTRGEYNMNIGETREQAYAREVNARVTARNTHATDGTYPDGTTYEFKTLIGSKPSLGGKKTLENVKTIKEAIERYIIADWFVVEIQESCYLKMNKATAVEWLTARVALSKASAKRGGWYKLRILKNPTTQESTEAIQRAGYSIE